MALDILNDLPHDLAAYHSLAKVSIMKRDFNILRLFLNAGNFAKLDKDLYDYTSFEEIKTFISRLSKEVYDQSFFRRGNIQSMEFVNCMGENVPFNEIISKLPSIIVGSSFSGQRNEALDRLPTTLRT